MNAVKTTLKDVLIVCFIKCSILEEELPNGLSGILEELVDHELKTDNINMNLEETKSINKSRTSHIEVKSQSTENVHKRNNVDSYTEVDEFGDIYKISNINTSDPKAHIEVTKITKDNSTVKIEYAPKSIQYIIEPEKSTTEVIKDSEDQYTENVKINSDMTTNKTILENYDNTSNESNNIYIKTRKSGSDININVLGLNENLKNIVLEVNKMKSLHENNEETKAEKEISIDKSLKEPIGFLPYNFILRNVYPGLPVNRVVYQQAYHNNFIIKPSLFPRRHYLFSNYKIRPKIVQRVIPKITKVYSYNPYYIG